LRRSRSRHAQHENISSTWLVRQGWVEPKDTALAEAAKAAKDERLGLWRAGD
jgi:endonuclease YncB( thermonuclease family)